MAEQDRSKTFVKNDNSMLGMALLTRDSGIPASHRLKIKDEVVALDFDLAVSLRLNRYDLELAEQSQKNLAIRIGNAVARGMGFSEEEEPEPSLPDFVKDDPYADENTVIN